MTTTIPPTDDPPAIDLDAIRARHAKVTPGPWFAHNPDDINFMNAYAVSTSETEPIIDQRKEADNDFGEIVALTLLQSPRLACHEAGRWQEDAEFIAYSWSDIPALCREVAALRTEVAVRDTIIESQQAAMVDAMEQRDKAREEAVRLREIEGIYEGLCK